MVNCKEKATVKTNVSMKDICWCLLENTVEVLEHLWLQVIFSKHMAFVVVFQGCCISQ